MALTAKQKLFCEEYMKNGYNPVNAYRIAFPDAGEGTLRVNPYRLMKNPDVCAYLSELEEQVFSANRITAEKIAHELSLMAFGEFDDNISPTVKLKALDLLQKQWNLQGQKLDVTSKQDIVITIGDDEEE